MTQPSPPNDTFVRQLGLLDSTMLVAGSMIGSGIFIVSADIARLVGSAGWLLVVWAVTGALTLIAALSYGELAAMMPRAGGQYVYLREAYSPLWGFLYGWTLFLVIQTGTIAAVAVAFARFLGVLAPAISPTQWIIPPIILSTKLRGQSFDAAVGRDPDYRVFDVREHARASARQAHPKYFHVGENVVAARVDRSRHFRRPQCRCAQRQLHEHVDARRGVADQVRPVVRRVGVGDGRRAGNVDRRLRGAGWLAVFIRTPGTTSRSPPVK